MNWTGYDNLNLPGEIWKEVAGYEGLYEVSDQGRVRSMPRVLVDCLGRRSRWKSKILDGGVTGGYRTIMLCKPNSQYMESVARLVALAFKKNPKNKPEVNHKNGNKLDNSADNLEWSTHQENCAHRQAVLRKCICQDGPGAVMTNAQVRKMRKIRAETGATYPQIAKMFSLNKITVYAAITGRSWKHLNG